MAFNLEFKITYDELAPSLQDMFKSLQSQITDNRNGITDINIDIEDIANEINNINQEITNIKNDITNIENDITKIENNIQNIENTITDIENTITEIEGDITNIEETVNIIQGMTADGEHGQVVKIDKNSEQKGALFADDNFHEMLVFETDEEIEEFKKSYDYNVSMQEIFNTWQQNLCVDRSMYTLGLFKDQSTNVDFQIRVNSKDSHWKFRDDLGAIQMSFNNSWYSMFISKELYPSDSYIEIYIEGIEKDDDDFISIIFGYKQDNDSSFHTLEFVSTGNHQNQCNYKSWVTYDMGQPTCKLLLSQPLDSNFNTSTGTGRSKMKIVKTSNSVTVSRAKFYNSESAVLSAPYDYTATYTLPTTKPNDWDQVTYDNIKTMFGSSKLGFGTFSWNCIFKIISSNTGIMSESLYNLNTDSIQSYKDGKWVVSSDKVSDVIPYRVFLYNDYNDTLFFYYYKQTYCKIATSGGGVTEVINELVASGSEGQILKIHNNGITPDNNFRVLRVVDNDTDFNEESKTIVTMKSIFNTWSRHNVFVKDVIFGREICLDDGGKWVHGYDTNPTAANWTFIEPNYIKNSNNQSPFSMFISNDTFTDHEITLFCHRLDNDDDMLIWIVAWAENPDVGNNGFDTLSIIKMDTYQNSYTSGTNTYNTGVVGDRRMVYRLVLNLGTSRQFSIVNEDKMINTTLCRNQSKGRDYKLYVKRAGRTITWKISALGPNDPNQCPLLDSTTVSYTFPNTKPDGWTDDNWNIVQKLLGSPQKVGVGTLSQPCQFTIVESSLFNDVDIYRLDKDAIYTYDSSKFKYVDSGKIISDDVPLHSWIYNKTTKKLFHFSSSKNYTLIDH